jgi:peptidoglycan/xylan/chitin deacetylase (PgdA/CDA1 family)
MNLNHSVKVIQKKTEELRKKPAAKVLLVALFLCLILLSVLVKKGTENGATLQTAAAIGADSSFGDRELPIYSVDTAENKVALSFDAAWGADDFQKIMDVLDAHNVKVTFFMTGGWIESYPECVKTLVEKGHDLGNHSEHHYDMASLSKAKQQEELMSAHEKVKELTGYEMCLFRPPYGSYNNSLINTAYECGYYPIQWSVDSLDWKDYGVDSIIKTVCEHLEQLGYEIVPISELILRENYHMDVTGKQIAN